MNSTEFRAELVKIMPGYAWTVHKPLRRYEVKGLSPQPLEATGIQSSGSNRISTLSVSHREKCGKVIYTAKSSGYGLRAKWLHEIEDGTLARALRRLQDHYESIASTYLKHAGDLKVGRKESIKEGGAE